MAIKRASLQPIGRAIEKAQKDLKALAEKAPPNQRRAIQEKIKTLNIMLKDVQSLCALPKPFGFSGEQKSYKTAAKPFGVYVC